MEKVLVGLVLSQKLGLPHGEHQGIITMNKEGTSGETKQVS